MPAAGVRLGAINVPRLEHALEGGDAMLFVELRTLREVGDAIEVVDREQIGPPFGAGGDDLRGLDLREMLQAQILTEVLEDERLDAEDVPDRIAPRRKRPVCEPRFLPDGGELAAGV